MRGTLEVYSQGCLVKSTETPPSALCRRTGDQALDHTFSGTSTPCVLEHLSSRTPLRHARRRIRARPVTAAPLRKESPITFTRLQSPTQANNEIQEVDEISTTPTPASLSTQYLACNRKKNFRTLLEQPISSSSAFMRIFRRILGWFLQES